MSPFSILRIAVVLLVVWTPRPPAVAIPDDEDRWIRIETANFTVLSNAAERRAIKVGKKLEQLREVLSELSPEMVHHSPLPTTIFAFRNARAFAPYNLGPDGRPDDDAAGYFVRSMEGNFIAVDCSSESLPMRVIYHEYMHYFLENNIPAIPLWLNEGIAEFYSTMKVRHGKAEIGRPIVEHLQWLSNHRWIPLEELFAIDTSSRQYHEGNRRSTFYAESWILTHYLLLDPERRDGFDRLLHLVGQGVPSAEAFESAFGIDLGTAREGLTRYVQGEMDRRETSDPPEAFGDQPVKVEPLGRKELLYHLGDLLAHHRPVQSAEAEHHLQQALALDPNFTDAHVALAWLRLSEERPAEAIVHARKALSIAPGHSRALVVYGTALVEQFDRTLDRNPPPAGRTPELLLQARDQFRKALEVSPGQVEALIGLGTTYIFDREDLADAIEATAQASKARPARKDVLRLLIVLTARSGDVTGARNLLDRALRPGGDVELIRSAEIEIARMEMEQASSPAR